MSGFPEYFFRSERFSLPLLAEVVDTHRGRQTAALFIADGRGRQHDGGNDEGEGLTDLSGNGGQIEAVFVTEGKGIVSRENSEEDETIYTEGSIFSSMVRTSAWVIRPSPGVGPPSSARQASVWDASGVRVMEKYLLRNP